MTLDECINLLTEHQRWRTSKPPYDGLAELPCYTASSLTAAIDYAIEELHRLKGLEK